MFFKDEGKIKTFQLSQNKENSLLVNLYYKEYAKGSSLGQRKRIPDGHLHLHKGMKSKYGKFVGHMKDIFLVFNIFKRDLTA